ncbi:SDR family oxidoreductase [Bradyrhizobium sp. NBAIM03]|uniref:SDR family oxidoreductase n=1 Tax=Bradyrhizobium sp. NBAIM03 TaxID=2793816 RepID=UPI001CD6787B|nr:SDR family oxidoreductase [Bradyrhizobium sp. NBAIM03]MCA1533853.1 SDR family oxidoreductase [Bradyrhizobium sp. NBAIM03]
MSPITASDLMQMMAAAERRATVDEIAVPFLFLAFKAASSIAGSVLAVDGGYTAN